MISSSGDYGSDNDFGSDEAVTEFETPAHRYDAAMASEIEIKWQKYWRDHGVYETPNPSGPLGDPSDPRAHLPKLFIMDMFPYPSGDGLHVGHPLGYIATDVYARFKRMAGLNVLHTMGFDAFGLPAEEHARQTGQHPRENTEANIANMTRQLDRLGLGHDKRRAIATTDVDYYRWTQWIFLKFFNSWFDPEVDKARPISELVSEFENDVRQPSDGRKWQALTDSEKAATVNGHRLAYMDEADVNWCPALGTVLANEEVTAEGRSERGNHEVFKRPLRQWMLRITSYADRLLDDLDLLDWPESIKTMQRNWIGRSEGAFVSFPVCQFEKCASEKGFTDGDFGSDDGNSGGAIPELTISVFTTRPDTLFGATYMVLAPEHPLVDAITAEVWPEAVEPDWTRGAETPMEAVSAYRDRVATMSDEERQAGKTGVYLGVDAVVPVDGRRVPVFIADYVVMGYGTGAVMAVPGEDERDWDFAKRFGLPIIRTVEPPSDHPEDQAYTGEGKSINSGFLNGLDVGSAKKRMIEWLVETGAGSPTVTYKLRDWLFSRQRYWGEPFPVVFDENDLPVGLPESMLPVELPELSDWAPRALAPDAAPEPPLGRVADWAEVELDLDGNGLCNYRRELNTMPQWAGSCWYYLRYLDPTNDETFVDAEVEKYWMSDTEKGGVGGVDLYVGGVEHAVLHLLYARFWHKVLYDLGYVSGPEPFKRLVNQGYILAAAYCDERGAYVPADKVEGSSAKGFTFAGKPVERLFGKMGKSLKNSVSPDEMYVSYGADTLRLYEMFMGPIDQDRPWQTRSVVGAQRLLQRVWRNIVDEHTGKVCVADRPASKTQLQRLHRTIAGVRSDMEAMRFNTAIAKLTELNNFFTGEEHEMPGEVASALVRMLAPLVPHFAEELWQRLNDDAESAESVVWAKFPEFDPAYLQEDTIELPVQVNGKVRGRIVVAATADESEVLAAAFADSRVAVHIDGQSIIKQMYVPGRIVVIVVEDRN